MSGTKLRVPSIHLNGTSRESLVNSYMEQYRAVRAARDTMAQHGPNGRDYYVQGDGAFAEAQRQHRDRLDRLDEIENELEQIIGAIAE